MKRKTLYSKVVVLILFFFVIDLGAEIKEFTESVYLVQAPKKIVAKVNNMAQLMEFDGPYEVAIPKKAGIQVNPWSKFIAQGFNPKTKNHFIIVNPEWFLALPQEQQDFFLGQFFAGFKYGCLPLSAKVSPFLFIFVSWLCIFMLFCLLGKTKLKNYKKWMRFIVALVAINLVNRFVFVKLHEDFLQYLKIKHSMRLSHKVIEKTRNKNAAIKALETYDSAIKKEIKSGETFFAPFESLYEARVKALKKQ